MFIKLSIEQEIVTLLKLLNYPYMHTITRSHFSAVGAIIGHFRNIILVSKLNLSLLTLNDDDFWLMMILIKYSLNIFGNLIVYSLMMKKREQQQQQANNW